MKKKRTYIILFGLILGVSLVFYQVLFAPLTTKPDVIDPCVYVLKGEKPKSVQQQLNEQLSKVSAFSVRLLFLFFIDESKLKEGKYAVNNRMSSLDFIRNLRNGRQVVVKLVISKSRSYKQFETKMISTLHLDKTVLRAVMDSISVLDTLSTRDRPQSYFAVIIPETHLVFWNVTAKELSSKFKRAYCKFWNQKRLTQAAKLGLSKYEVIVLASIVEEETANNDEKGQIAAVYFNRLKKQMRLQADPTIIYAWQDYSIHRVLNKHLAINSPFNTYRFLGLPPAPICLPSIASVDAVLQMPITSNLYFCANPNFNGSHLFTSNYAEHLKNAHAYQAAYQAKFAK